MLLLHDDDDAPAVHAGAGSAATQLQHAVSSMEVPMQLLLGLDYSVAGSGTQITCVASTKVLNLLALLLLLQKYSIRCCSGWTRASLAQVLLNLFALLVQE
jgi:hypothetical protein